MTSSRKLRGTLIVKFTIIFAEPPDSPKAATEKYILALYGKTLVDFARDMERSEAPAKPKEANAG